MNDSVPIPASATKMQRVKILKEKNIRKGPGVTYADFDSDTAIGELQPGNLATLWPESAQQHDGLTWIGVMVLTGVNSGLSGWAALKSTDYEVLTAYPEPAPTGNITSLGNVSPEAPAPNLPVLPVSQTDETPAAPILSSEAPKASDSGVSLSISQSDGKIVISMTGDKAMMENFVTVLKALQSISEAVAKLSIVEVK